MDRNTPHKIIPNASVLNTLQAMRKLALEGRKDLEVIGLVHKICAGVAEGDYTGEVLAIYYWVCQNIRYIRDPDGVEMVKTPRKVLDMRSGDCDDIALLLAAMCMAAGNPVDFVVAGFAPGTLSHVFCAVRTPYGHMVLDPVANRVTDKMITDAKVWKIYPVTSGNSQMDAGIGELQHTAPGGGNLYSVYDYLKGKFDYFEASSKTIPATGQYRKVKVNGLGLVPEQMAAALPVDAVKIGEGIVAKGIVATKGKTSSPIKFNWDMLWGALIGGALVRLWSQK